jgi:hypothetical protein
MSFNYVEGVEPVVLKDNIFYDGIYTGDQKDVIKNNPVFNLASDLIRMAAKIEQTLRIGYCSAELEGNTFNVLHLVNRCGMAVMRVSMKDSKYRIANHLINFKERGKDKKTVESIKAPYLLKQFKAKDYALLKQLITESYTVIYKEIKATDNHYRSQFKTEPAYPYADGGAYFAALKLAFSDDKQHAVSIEQHESSKKAFDRCIALEQKAAENVAEIEESFSKGVWIIGYEPNYKRMIFGGGKIKAATIEYDIPLRLCNADFTNLQLEEPIASDLLFSLALCKTNREKLPDNKTWDATGLIPTGDKVFKETASVSYSTNGVVNKYNPQWFLVAR